MTAILRITDGNLKSDGSPNEVDFIKPINRFGYHLVNWNQAITPLKGGGVYQDSSIAEGRRLVFRQRDNAFETFTLKINGNNQNTTIEEGQKVFDLLEQALNYWTLQDNDNFVYLEVKANNETNTRYAIVHGYSIVELPGTFQQPFLQPSCVGVYDDFDIVIERGHWLENVPGAGASTIVSSKQSWQTINWELNSTTPSGLVTQIVQKPSNGDLYAIAVGTSGAVSGDIVKSTDDGATWVQVLAVGGGPVSNDTQHGALLVDNNGDIYAGVAPVGVPYIAEIRKSTDDGATWPIVYTSSLVGDSTIRAIIEASNGDIYAIEDDTTGLNTPANVLRSTDNGSIWGIVWPTLGLSLIALTEATPDVFFVTGHFTGVGFVSRSVSGDLGTWGGYVSFLGTIEVPEVAGFTWDGVNYIYYIYVDTSGNTEIRRSIDNGITFVTVLSFTYISPVTRMKIILLASGVVYVALGGGFFYFSGDNGDSWVQDDPSVATVVYTIVQTSDLSLYSGADTGIIKSDIASIVEYGNNSKVFVANKRNIANITNIKLFDTPLYTDVVLPIVSPLTLFADVPPDDDIIYFGISDSVLNTGTFSNIVFNLSTASRELTILWEYWNGAAWSTLIVTDNTLFIESLSRLGINTICWTTPSDWVQNTIDNVTAFWVRAGVTSASTISLSPVQDTDQIYSVIQPFIELTETEVGGDLAALINLKMINVSDLDGKGGSAPNLYDNRAIVSTKRIDVTNEDFTMFINASTTQNLLGVVVIAGTNTAIGTNIVTSSTEEAVYTPVGIEAIADRLEFSLSSTVARNFYGKYRLFLRGKQTGGAAGDIFMDIQVQSGSGGLQFTTEQQVFITTNDWQLIDFGKIAIPVTSDLLLTELTDDISITIRAGTSNASAVLTIYDIVLVPIDGVWSGDFIDIQNTTGSEIAGQHSLNVDSITNPRTDIRGLIKNETTGFFTSRYQTISTKPIVPNDTRFRMYFLFARFGASNEWVSEPWVVHCIELQTSQRYFSARGSN